MSCTIVLVDAINFANVLADRRLADTILRQVRAADLILLTKTEAAGPDALDSVRMILAGTSTGVATAIVHKGAHDIWKVLADTPEPSAGRIRAAELTPHILPFDSWSWRGDCKVDRDDVLSFANDPALNIYRLKGRLHLKDGQSIVLHKVGSEIAIEQARSAFERSELVAIGAKPGFDPSRLEVGWAHLVSSSPTPAEGD